MNRTALEPRLLCLLFGRLDYRLAKMGLRARSKHVVVNIHLVCIKLQALVYDILPSTTAVFSYTIGSRKLSANEQFFCWCSNSSKSVTNNSIYIRLLFYVAMLLTPAQIKPESFESRGNFFFSTRGGCVSCLRAWFGARLLLQSYQYPNLSEGADRVAVQLRGAGVVVELMLNVLRCHLTY